MIVAKGRSDQTSSSKQVRLSHVVARVWQQCVPSGLIADIPPTSRRSRRQAQCSPAPVRELPRKPTCAKSIRKNSSKSSHLQSTTTLSNVLSAPKLNPRQRLNGFTLLVL